MEQTLRLQGFTRKILDWIRAANFTAAQIVPVVFLSVILLGSLLLMTPFASTGRAVRFIDALFTMTSAVCVTGLIVLDTPKDFTIFGQLVILAGIGFLVFRDILDNFHGERVRFSTHTKLAFLVTGLLIVGGTAGIWGFEIHNDRTLGALPPGEQIMVAYFHSVSARTAGFNTVDLNLMSKPALSLLILLMLVGGSPGSTAGGIKRTTIGIIVASLWGMLRGRADVMMFHRRIPQEIVIKSFV